MAICLYLGSVVCVFLFKQKTAYEMRISDWSSDVCSSDLVIARARGMRDRIRGVQREHAQLGTYSPEIHAAFTEARLYAILPPRRYGGPQLGLKTFRSEARRVGQKCVSKCRSRWWPFQQKKNTIQNRTTNTNTNHQK